jgi:hypothetical protein
MGYLTVKGKLMTYSEYKDKIENYKIMGLREFQCIYKAHKDRFIEKSNLHWGEEMEYSLFYLDPMSEKVMLADQGFELIDEFSVMKNTDIVL